MEMLKRNGIPYSSCSQTWTGITKNWGTYLFQNLMVLTQSLWCGRLGQIVRMCTLINYQVSGVICCCCCCWCYCLQHFFLDFNTTNKAPVLLFLQNLYPLLLILWRKKYLSHHKSTQFVHSYTHTDINWVTIGNDNSWCPLPNLIWSSENKSENKNK